MAFVEGGWLAVATETGLQVFDVNEPDAPFDLATVALGGPPLAVGAANGMVLVAVAHDEAVDEIVVVAADPYRRGIPAIINSLQISEAVHTLLTSAGVEWSVALGADGYHVLRLNQPTHVESSALVRTPGVPVAGALAGDGLLVALGDEDRIDRFPLRLGPGLPTASASLSVESGVSAMAATVDGMVAVAALENDTLVLFDPVTLEEIGRLLLEDGPVSALHFAEYDARRLLILQIENRPAVMLLDVTELDSALLPGSAATGTGRSIRASAASGALFALATDDMIRLLTFE